MSSYTKSNLEQWPNVASRLGIPDTTEMLSGRAALGAEHVGMTFWRVAPGHRLGLGHAHDTSEELYLVLSGSGRFKVDDEVFEIGARDVVSVAPRAMREYEAGPDGLEVVAFGPHVEGESSRAEPNWWSD